MHPELNPIIENITAVLDSITPEIQEEIEKLYGSFPQPPKPIDIGPL